MLKPHAVLIASLFAPFIATGQLVTAEAGPCVLGTGSTTFANTCIGTEALSNNTTGAGNTASGTSALIRNTTGSNNTANGSSVLFSNTIGSFNTASGVTALYSNTTGSNNTANGAFSLTANTTGNFNTANGTSVLYKNTTGYNNNASGSSALYSNTSGYNNTANGTSALLANTTGANNTASGASALSSNTIGSRNIALGFKSGSLLTTGSDNIIIGNQGSAGDFKTIRVGVQGTQTRTFIAGIRSAAVSGGQTVLVDENGQLGVVLSSRRYKENIEPMGDASDVLMKLRPVIFRYKEPGADGSKPLQYGLIAEEVEQVVPNLVIYNKDGTPESVAYHLLPSLLLNEYQKQARKLADAETELAGSKAKLAENDLKLQAIEAELAALKLEVSHLVEVPASARLASSVP